MRNFCFISLIILIFSSCEDSKPNEQKIYNKDNIFYDTSSSEVKSEVVKLDSVKPTENLKYIWLENFNFKTSLQNQIPPPTGFKRKKLNKNSFGYWLRFLPLLPKEEKVKLHDGSLKSYQGGFHRIINIDIGKADLQQCADAVMRLRSEYLYSKNDFEKIHFNFTNGTNVSFDDWRNGRKPVVKGNKVTFSEEGKKDDSYLNFKKYLKQIFMYAGTASLEKEMKSVNIQDMQIGDVLIQGGHPGHAILIIDMAENEKGGKVFLVAQSYMPAQSIHILKNFENEKISPWYELNSNNIITTPEWDFSNIDLKRFVD